MSPANAPAISLSALDLILQAGPVVKLVMISLLGSSLLSWSVIFSKVKRFKSARLQNKEFQEVFWSGKSLDEVYAKAETLQASPVANVFRSGFRELRKLSSSDRSKHGEHEVVNVNRALNRASNLEIEALEKNTSWLATVASSAPFVGLFGTVWGIMNSFQNIGATGAANLAVVAPGISEALIATAIGLAAAIPALIFYNAFVNQVKSQANEMDNFVQDFLNLVQRSLMSGASENGGRKSP